MAAGVAETAEGEQLHVIASSEPRGYLRKGVTTNSDEIVAAGDGHAETTIIDWSNEQGHRVVTVGAGRPICNPCAEAIEKAGATPTTPLKDRLSYGFIKIK